ncbi:MAG: N-terminal cleavage protein [Pedosphaera sp.]|nr:N-terminal cleavage protein [Pedosphaera sp.]
MSTRNREPGFTLIEALLLIAILCILGGLLLPTLSGSHKSPTTGCLQNLKLIGVGSIMYAEDNSHKLPNLDQLPGNDGPAALFLITRYIRETNSFICPWVAKKREADRPWYRDKFVPELNRAFFQSNGNDYAYYDSLRVDSNMVAVAADRFAWTNRSNVLAKLLNHPDRRVNVAFSDGHAERFRSASVIVTNLVPAWSAVQDPLRRP